MTNKERYKKAFSTLHASDNFYLEVEKMQRTSNQRKFKTIVASVAACVMVVGSISAAYAMDLGGIQRTLQLWINGDQTEVTVQFDGDGSYKIKYPDKDENTITQGGGGVSYKDDGTEIPQSEDELIAQQTAPDVRYEDDGSVTVYWYDQKIDITDKFENDICYVKLVNGEETLYMTVKYQNGYATSPNKYLSPSSFN